jgi:hypothetical protein
VFSFNLTTTGVSFAAALRGSTAQQQQPQARQVPVADPPVDIKLSTLLLDNNKTQVSQFGLEL